MPRAVSDTLKLAALFAATLILCLTATAIWHAIDEGFKNFPG